MSYNLYQIYYNSGDWGGHSSAYFFAQSEEEVKEKSKEYAAFKKRADKNPGHTFLLSKVEPKHLKYVNLLYIENFDDFDVSLYAFPKGV